MSFGIDDGKINVTKERSVIRRCNYHEGFYTVTLVEDVYAKYSDC